MSKGGFRAFRGSSATAAAYLLERDSARLDDYYAEGGERVVQHVVVGDAGTRVDVLDHDEFKTWMEHHDPKTGEQRRRLRSRTDIDPRTGAVKLGGSPLYQETLISSSKSLSVAAAADPSIAEALERAMERATVAMAERLHEHVVTRIGSAPQREVQLERLEFTSVQHRTSRAGDPHWHRHVQLLTTGYAEGKWRAIYGGTSALYSLPETAHAAADLAIATDVELRQAIADAGYTWQPGEGGGEVAEFLPQVDQFSSRRDQIATNREALESQWRAEHPGQEPGPALRQSWDQLGWAQERPEKAKKAQVAVLDRDELAARIVVPAQGNPTHAVAGQTAAQISPAVIASTALADLEERRAAWSRADLEGAIDRRLADTYLLGDTGLADLRRAALEAAQPELVSFFDEGVEASTVRHYTSRRVIASEREIGERLLERAQRPGQDGSVVEADRGAFTLSDEQVAAAEAITGTHALVVVEGAAGAGKTTMLEAANDIITASGRRMVVVSPTKRGALEAGAAIDAEGSSVHAMLYRAGASVDDATGRWVLPTKWRTQPEEFRMDERTVLVVDEAGMLDHETARVLHRYVDDQRVGSLVLTGDTRQLAAVGRGGYLARAAKVAATRLDLRDVRRFKTPAGEIDETYAEATVRLRERQDPDAFFDLLVDRGQVRTGTPDEVIDRVAETVALELSADQRSIAIASTNATAQRINHAVFQRLVDAGVVDAHRVLEGRDGDPIAVGARVATRQNDSELGVANREAWTVERVNADGRIVVVDEQRRRRTLDAGYVKEHVQLAYAVTAHGAQGMTVDTAHTVLSDEMDAAGVYVGLTRGRRANVLHAVAVDEQDARDQFTQAIARERADLGLDAARARARADVEGLDLTATSPAQRPPSFGELLEDTKRRIYEAGDPMPWLDDLRRTRRIPHPEDARPAAFPVAPSQAPAPSVPAPQPGPAETVAVAPVAEEVPAAEQVAAAPARRVELTPAKLAAQGDEAQQAGTPTPNAAVVEADAELQRLGEEYPQELAEIRENRRRGLAGGSLGAAAVDAKVAQQLRIEALAGKTDGRLEATLRMVRDAHAPVEADLARPARSESASAAPAPAAKPAKPRTAAQERLAAMHASQQKVDARIREREAQAQSQGMQMG